MRTSGVGVLEKSYQCPQYFHCVLLIQELQGQTAETLQNGLLTNPPQCQKEFARKKISVFKKKNENRDSLLDVTLKYSKKDKACPARCSADKGGCF